MKLADIDIDVFPSYMHLFVSIRGEKKSDLGETDDFATFNWYKNNLICIMHVYRSAYN